VCVYIYIYIKEKTNVQESSEAERELYSKITMRVEAALLALEEEAKR